MSQRNGLLDGWRGVSILAVIFGHLVGYRLSTDEFLQYRYADLLAHGAEDPLAWLRQFVVPRLFAVGGGAGVLFFFVISGFIITFLLLKEESARGEISVSAFYLRRACRILPPFAAMMAMTLWLRRTGLVSFPDEAALHAGAFLCNTGVKCTWWFGHTWSLAVEEQFYLAWPLLFMLAPARRVEILVVLCGALSLRIAWCAVNGVPDEIGQPFTCIALGALCALSDKARAVLSSFTHPLATLLGLSVVLVGLTAVISVPAVAIVVQTAVPFAVAALLFSSFNQPFLSRIISSRPLRAVGLVSYSLYLYQQAFLANPSQYNGAPPSMIFMLVAAFASVLLLERPFIRLGKVLTRRLQRSSAEAAAWPARRRAELHASPRAGERPELSE